MTYETNLPDVDVQFVCCVCDGLEVAAPGAEPPSPPVCHACDRLALADLLTGVGVAW
ncbi:hypothetical protein [Nonomuraea endophytica]|uniref:hypothetical protein n=1 Tax=Nonomuraea endophytica TaxID=714136 RepID=UPI0037C547EA